MQVENLSIRRAGVADAPVLTELSVTTFTDAFSKDNRKENMDKYIAEEMNLDKITSELADNENVFFLAYYQDTPVGYAKVRATKKPALLWKNKPMEIERIYVLQDHQGKKIGAALMTACLAHAADKGYDVAWLGVWALNYKAVNFYKQWGFELFGSHKFRLGDDMQTDVLMKKKL
jgi:ribosomal protein S18 acetylase RimI-like enzyme